MTSGRSESAPPGPAEDRYVAARADLVDGVPLHVEVAGVPMCLVRDGNHVYALRDECSHQNVPLSEGEVEDGAIECWLHGSRFDLATGAVLNPPATEPVPVYPTHVTDAGQVYLSLEPASVREG